MGDATEPAYMAWARERFGRPRPHAAPPNPLAFQPGPGRGRHPSLAALPPEVRLAVYRGGHLREVEAGDRLAAGCGVLFVLTGAVGLFSRNGICVRLAGPGSVINAQELADVATGRETTVLMNGVVLALRGPELTNILGRERAAQLLIKQMLVQQADLEREAACNALHLAGERMARWLLMLYQAADGRDIPMTQAALAGMLGIQRTSVNAAARALHERGGLRFVRGRVRVLQPEVLAAQACACVCVSGDSRTEQETDRLAAR